MICYVLSPNHRYFGIRLCMWMFHLFSTWAIFQNHEKSQWIYLIGEEVKLTYHHHAYTIDLIKLRIVEKHDLDLTTNDIGKIIVMFNLILEDWCLKSTFCQSNFTARMSLLFYKGILIHKIFVLLLFYINMFYFVLSCFHILSSKIVQ